MGSKSGFILAQLLMLFTILICVCGSPLTITIGGGDTDAKAQIAFQGTAIKLNATNDEILNESANQTPPLNTTATKTASRHHHHSKPRHQHQPSPAMQFLEELRSKTGSAFESLPNATDWNSSSLILPIFSTLGLWNESDPNSDPFSPSLIYRLLPNSSAKSADSSASTGSGSGETILVDKERQRQLLNFLHGVIFGTPASGPHQSYSQNGYGHNHNHGHGNHGDFHDDYDSDYDDDDDDHSHGHGHGHNHHSHGDYSSTSSKDKDKEKDPVSAPSAPPTVVVLSNTIPTIGQNPIPNASGFPVGYGSGIGSGIPHHNGYSVGVGSASASTSGSGSGTGPGTVSGLSALGFYPYPMKSVTRKVHFRTVNSTDTGAEANPESTDY